jgi:hypothetical protein
MIVLLLLTPFWGFAFIIAVGLTTAFQALLSRPTVLAAAYFATDPNS